MSSQEVTRRSTRQLRRVPLLLLLERQRYTAETAVISRHGALVLCRRSWPVETPLEMQNQKTGASSKARVAWVGGEDRPGLFKLGVEMLEDQPDFWGDDYELVDHSQAPPPEAPPAPGGD